MNNENNEIEKNENKGDVKRVLLLVFLFLIVFMLVFFLVYSFKENAKKETTESMGTERNLQVKENEKEKELNELGSPGDQISMEAKIIYIDEENAVIRAKGDNNKMYSIGFSEETEFIGDSKSIDVSELKPNDKVIIYSSVSEKTGYYDVQATSINIVGHENLPIPTDSGSGF